MDIDDGYILWTGIWKALGNSKADIVKMIDSQPDLAPLIRRVRGGYLKIQGTWMPYEVALKLSRRVAWSIRDELIPLFGPTFPSTCLSPDQPGYGQVIPSGQNRRRARRSTQSSIMQMPRAHTGWTVVTPSTGLPAPPSSSRDPPPPLLAMNARSSDYSLASPYQSHSHPRPGTPSDRHLHSPLQQHDVYPTFSTDAHRYPPSSYRKPTSSSKTGLSLDIHSLSVGERSPELSRPRDDDLRLPPIQSHNVGKTSESPYALPPISAMEDLHQSLPQDSAAVLRRLRMDDDDQPWARNSDGERSLQRRHSLSSRPSSSKSLDVSPRFQPYSTARSYQEHSTYRARSPPSSYPYSRSSKTDQTRPVWSDASYEGDSTSNPSPTSPNTPNSISENEDGPHSRYGSSVRGKPFPGFSDRLSQRWQNAHAQDGHTRISSTESLSVRRHSYEVHSDSDSNHPHRPW